MLRSFWAKLAVFLACAAPLGVLVWRVFHEDLGPNPLETLQHFTGDWTLRLVVATLTVTPLRKLPRLAELIRFRRMLGLFAFFYGCLHFSIYLYFDKLLDWQEIAKDVGKRPFITVGFAGLAAMAPLALTSTKGWVRRLGGHSWQRLHRLVYFTAIAAVVHYYWLVKSDVRRPLVYATLVGALLLVRVVYAFRKRVGPRRPAGVSRTAPQ